MFISCQILLTNMPMKYVEDSNIDVLGAFIVVKFQSIRHLRHYSVKDMHVFSSFFIREIKEN